MGIKQKWLTFLNASHPLIINNLFQKYNIVLDKVVGFEPTIITYVNTTLPNS